MPQLISHWDAFGWQTPNVQEVLVTPVKKQDRTAQLRSLSTVIVRKCAELGAPVRLKDVEAFASHVRYHLVPDKVGERPVTLADLERIFPQILPELNTNTAQLVMLRRDDPTISLLARTAANHPLSLSELLQQKTFTDAIPYTSFALGVDLDHNAIVRDLSQDGHLLLVGASVARLHLQLGIALTLILFNSPQYLRIGLVGDDTSHFRLLTGSPHVLGNIITNTRGVRRLFDGLLKHHQQRRGLFEEQGVETLDAYNKLAISDKALKPLPRLVILLDTVALHDWHRSQDTWMTPLLQLLGKSAEVGIHIIMTSRSLDLQTLPERISSAFSQRIIMRSALSQLEGRYKLPAYIPLEFVDAILLSKENGMPMGVEMAAVSEGEITRTVNYWAQMKKRRAADLENKGQPAYTGNTGLLTLRADMLPPPVNENTPSEASTRAIPVISDGVVASAQALAAYLGWLSAGPLRDVLHLSTEEAEETINILRGIQVLEPGEGPVYRFARLADVPNSLDRG